MKSPFARAVGEPLQRLGAASRSVGDGRSGQTDERSGGQAATEQRCLRVLLVEDLPRVQTLLRELIVEPGRIEVAGLVETEADAVAQYVELQPDVVVIDLNLRSGTGLGVIMGVRKMQRTMRPLLIVLTNHALPVLEAACLNAGADYFLDKSRDFHKVRPLLENAWSSANDLPRTADLVRPPAGPVSH
jgi:CheY-like chemotaxis protein